MALIESILPIECIHAVISHVHDCGTLFSLLTVSKAVFFLAVRKLYSSPFRFTRNPAATRLLYQLVLRLSPADDKDVERAKEAFQLIPSQLQQQGALEAPFTDYLALIRHADFPEQPDIFYHSISAELHDLIDKQDVISWAACGHCLSQIRTLQLTPGSAVRFEPQIAHMTNLEKIVWAQLWSNNWHYPTIHSFIETFADVHGDTKSRKLRMLFPSHWPPYHPKVIRWNAILGCPSSSSLSSNDSNNEFLVVTSDNCNRLLQLNNPQDFDAVRAIDITVSNDLGDKIFSVLPRLHNLESFLGGYVGFTGRPFQWAVEEYRDWLVRTHDVLQPSQRTLLSSMPPPTLPQPTLRPPLLPPLKMIVLDCEDPQFEQTIQDVTEAFCNTIEWIQVKTMERGQDALLESIEGGIPPISRLGSGWRLPALRRLSLHIRWSSAGLIFDPRAFVHSPLLEVLQIKDPSHLIRIPHDHPPPNGYDEEQDSNTSTPIHHDSPSLPRFQLSEPWRLRHLRELKIYALAAAEFDPTSFHEMKALEHLHLGLRSMPLTMRRSWPREKWTWTWTLPQLTHLTLEGFVASTFRFQCLHTSLPMLDTLWIDLDGKPSKLDLGTIHVNMMRLPGELPISNGGENYQIDRGHPYLSPHPLRMVTLEGMWCVLTEGDIQALLDSSRFSHLEHLRMWSLPWCEIPWMVVSAMVHT